MQHAVSGEDFQRSVVHSDGDVQRDFLARIFQVTVEALLESQFVGGDFKTRLRVLVDIHLFRNWSLQHAKFSLETCSQGSVNRNRARSNSSSLTASSGRAKELCSDLKAHACDK